VIGEQPRTFNFDFAHYMLAGVIWCIGWCMVLMAALIWPPVRIVNEGQFQHH